MAQDSLPEAVRTLVTERITSVEQLEILLLMRERPGTSFDAARMSEEIRTSERSAAARLGDLHDRGFLARDGDAFRYEPATEALRSATDRLASTYAERRYTIIDLIFSKPIDNLRLYADAFRLRKESSDG